MADLIVDGEIIAVENSTYTFKIHESIKGIDESNIQVRIWKNWTCDLRPGKLVQGQRLILFLWKDENDSYVVINGSTGELIVNSDRTINRNYYHEYPDVYNVKYSVKKFLESFSCNAKKRSNGSTLYSFKQKIKDSDLEKLKETASFFKYIVNGLPKE